MAHNEQAHKNSATINTLSLALNGELGIDDGDINPEVELTNLHTDNPNVWFKMSHRISHGSVIGLSRDELLWLVEKMDEHKVEKV